MWRRTPHSAVAGSAAGLRFAIVAAGYNPELAEALLEHCRTTLTEAGADWRRCRIVRVPGSFEIPVAAGRLARSRRYDCVIALGVVIQGQTSHADHIAGAVAQGLTAISIATGVPTVFGVVTARNRRQAVARCCAAGYNRGREAAQTGIAMARLCKSL
jgi:6,7-dimethyl-8-ribityllumazine synthase